MSAVPWNEYALRCEMKLTWENDGVIMARGFLTGSEINRSRHDMQPKYGVSNSQWEASKDAVYAALWPKYSLGLGVKPHDDSCIPCEHGHNAKQFKARAEQAHRDADLLISRAEFVQQRHVEKLLAFGARYGTPTGRVSASHPTHQQLPKEPNIMSDKPIEITTRTYVNGADISLPYDAAVYELIAKEEAKIEDLGKIKAKPKKLEAEIVKRQAGIDALVAYLNSKWAA